MGKQKNNERKIKEKINKDPLHKVTDDTKIKKKQDKNFKIKRKIKQHVIKGGVNAHLTALCRIESILPYGYLLKIIEQPIKESNLDYKIHDLFKYHTNNSTYQIGDIIEYTFKAPNLRSSRLIERGINDG